MEAPGNGLLYRGNVAKNNKTRFFYVLYSDKTRVSDQSERAYYPIYIINPDKTLLVNILYIKNTDKA